MLPRGPSRRWAAPCCTDSCSSKHPRPSTHQVCAEQEGVTTPAVRARHPAPQSRPGTTASPSSLASRYPRGQRGERLLPFLLQSGEVFFEGRADLVKQFHQGMTEKAGVCRFGIEVVCSRPARGKKQAVVIAETCHPTETCSVSGSLPK